MKKRKKGRGIRLAIAALVIMLIGILALILWKQWEYRAGADFYNSLRGALYRKGIRI